jgi:hypothetical protein
MGLPHLKSKGWRRMLDTRIVIDTLESTNGWSVSTNGTLSVDSNGAYGRSGLKLTHTTSTSAWMRKVFSTPVKAKGKYMRLWLNVHNAALIKRIDISIYMGAYPTPLNYYSYNLYTEGNQTGSEFRSLVDGIQQLDFHLFDANFKSGTPDSLDTIAAIQINVVSLDGQTGGAATFSNFEMAIRKGYIVFVNDNPYKEFIEDVTPFLAARNLPFNVQLTRDVIEGYLPSGTLPVGISPLSDLQILSEKGLLDLGIHYDSISQVTDADFAEFVRDVNYKFNKLGLLPDIQHATVLTNNIVNEARWEMMKAISPVIRVCANSPFSERSRSVNKNTTGAGYHAVLPSATTKLTSLPIQEFNDFATTSPTDASTVRSWVENAAKNQLGLYVFGHGTNRRQNDYRSKIETYRAFFDEYDKYRNKVDWLSIGELYRRYENTRDSITTRKTLFAY